MTPATSKAACPCLGNEGGEKTQNEMTKIASDDRDSVTSLTQAVPLILFRGS